VIGEIDLRHSPTCGTYWVRTIAYPFAVGSPVLLVEANISFTDQSSDDVPDNIIWFDGTKTAWTPMTVTRPKVASGTFDLVGGQEITQSF
jgi:hypothetical protein